MLSALFWLTVGVVIGLTVRDSDLRAKVAESAKWVWSKITNRGG